MPGMNGAPSPANPALTAAFRSALLNQGVLALLIFATLAITWVACRELLPAGARSRLWARQHRLPPEPAGRRIVRIGFGILWIFDAILQGQPAMPGGLPSRVIAPAAAGSPDWVRHLVDWAAAGWSDHPVQDAAAAVWIQLGIGVWLLASARGRWSRAAGLACAGWGLVAWVFGEAFGGLLGPGLSVLTGAPGAALLYVAGGLLVALPARCWASAGLGRRWLALLGAGLAAASVLQAWPGRGFWQGTLGGREGSLTGMVQSMAATAQPALLARLVTGFGSLVAAHGFAVNLLVVVMLAAGSAALLGGHRAVIGPAVAVLATFFLADWVLVQDLGFLGGVGTDPNSMVPLTLLLIGGFVAVVKVGDIVVAADPGTVEAGTVERGTVEPGTVEPGTVEPGTGAAGTRERPARRLRIAVGTASASVVVALWAGAVMVLGAAPMALAEVHRTADPIIATTLNGSPAIMDWPATPFDLTDQVGLRHVPGLGSRGGPVATGPEVRAQIPYGPSG